MALLSDFRRAAYGRSSATSAVMAARSDTLLGERYRRIARRRGKEKAIVAVGRSMLGHR